MHYSFFFVVFQHGHIYYIHWMQQHGVEVENGRKKMENTQNTPPWCHVYNVTLALRSSQLQRLTSKFNLAVKVKVIIISRLQS